MARLRPRSIRFRLTAWYATVLTLVLLTLIVIASEALDRRLSSNFDDDLTNTAAAIQRTAEVRSFGDGAPVSIDLPALDPFSVAGYFIQISLPDGSTEYRSDALGYRDLPLPDLTNGLDGLRFDTITIDNEHLRILYSPIRLRNSDVLLGVLSVAASTEQVDNAIQQMRLVLAVGAALALLASIAGGWFLAGRALKPVEQMRRDAAEIALDDPRSISLADRVRDPGTGDEISNLAQTFNDLLERLEDAFETERRFIADASHELRTPLTAIRGNVDVLLRQAERTAGASGDQLDALADIQREAARMSRLVEDLLTLARTSANTDGTTDEVIEIAPPVEMAVRTARAMAPDRTIELDVTGSPVAIADADQIEQVLLILLDNAVRHSQAPELVQVSVAPIQTGTRITVADEGEGIAPEHLPHLFDRFYRVDTSRSRQAGGSGLGLSIAQAIVERFDGEIAVASEPGVGTTFTIVLPDVSPHESARRQLPRDTSQ